MYRSPRTLLALFAVLYGSLFLAAYPTVAAAALAAGVVALWGTRRLRRRLDRRRGTLTVPGLGTIEYRFTRS